MTIASVLQGTARGLLRALRVAQEVINLPEGQAGSAEESP